MKLPYYVVSCCVQFALQCLQTDNGINYFARTSDMFLVKSDGLAKTFKSNWGLEISLKTHWNIIENLIEVLMKFEIFGTRFFLVISLTSHAHILFIDTENSKKSIILIIISRLEVIIYKKWCNCFIYRKFRPFFVYYPTKCRLVSNINLSSLGSGCTEKRRTLSAAVYYKNRFGSNLILIQELK